MAEPLERYSYSEDCLRLAGAGCEKFYLGQTMASGDILPSGHLNNFFNIYEKTGPKGAGLLD